MGSLTLKRKANRRNDSGGVGRCCRGCQLDTGAMVRARKHVEELSGRHSRKELNGIAEALSLDPHDYSNRRVLAETILVIREQREAMDGKRLHEPVAVGRDIRGGKSVGKLS